MTTITQATTENTSSHKTVKTNGIEVRKTENGDVVFINANYVSQKLIEIMTYILNDERYAHPDGTRYGHGVFSVVFRIDEVHETISDKMEEVPWLWLEGGKTMVCNLKRCVTLAFEHALSDEKDFKYSECVATWATVWQHIIAGFLHECHHAESFMDDAMRILTDDKALAKEEERADEYARLALFEMAKKVDIEPDLGNVVGAMYDEAFSLTCEELATAAEEDLTDKEKAFLENQEYLVVNGGVWYVKPDNADEKPHVLNTFKELMHLYSGDDLDDKSWAENTICLTNTSQENTSPATTTPQTQGQQVITKTVQVDTVMGEDYGYDYDMEPGGTYEQHYTEPAPQTPAPQTPANGFQGAVAGQPVAPGTPQAPNTYQAPANQQFHPQTPATNVGQPGVNPNAQVGANAYPASTLPPEQFQQVVLGLYNKIYTQIFGACGFNPTHGPDQPYFMQGAKIVDTIALSPEEQKITHGMECYDENGRIRMDVQVDNWISGRFMDKAKLMPGFSLTLSDMNGRQIKRKFIPQNPWKKSGTGYSRTALLAQQGAQIMWIIDPDANDKQYATRILNGALESNMSGSWQKI